MAKRIAPRHLPYLEADKAEILELLKQDQRPQGLNIGQMWHKLHIPRDRIRNAVTALMQQDPCPIAKIKPSGEMIKDFRNANHCAARYAIRKDINVNRTVPEASSESLQDGSGPGQGSGNPKGSG